MIFLLPIYLESIWEKQQFVMQQDFATNLLSSPSALILYDTSMYVRNNISISLEFHTSNVINHWIMVDIFIFFFIYLYMFHTQTRKYDICLLSYDYIALLGAAPTQKLRGKIST